MTEIARGEINVTLNDAEAIAGLRAVDREFDRTMDRIDREEAKASVSADLKELRSDLKKAEALLKDFERKRAEAQTATERRSTAQLLSGQKRRVAAIQEEVSERQNSLKALNDQIGALKAAERREAALARAVRNRAKENTAAATAVTRERAEVARLQQAYTRAAEEVAKLQKQSKRLSSRLSPRVQQRIEIDTERALAQMAFLRAQLEAMSHPPIDIDVEIDDGGIFARIAQSFANMTVRVGPFTATIKQLGLALTLLGPIITGLVGAAGALTGALGYGLAGAIGVASAGLLGFGMAAGGIFAIVKPLVGDFMDAKKATQAYDKALREHGRGSTEAKNALEKLNNIMGDVPQKTKEQYRQLGGLSDRWKRLTQSARPEFFKLMGDGIQTVSDLMPMFARNSTKAFSAVSGGLRDWMQGLRSQEGRNVLGDIFKNANAAIRPMMAGLGNLGAAFGRVAQSFSRHLRPLMQGFRQWSQGISDATSNTGRLDGTVNRMVNAMQSVGRVFAASGRVLGAFFRAAAGPGTGAMNDLADSLNRLAERMNSVSGQRGLRDFFNDSITTSSKFFRALEPLLKLFIEWTTIMRPFTNMALDVTRVIGTIVEAVASFGPVKGMIQAAFGLFLAGTIASKILAVAAGVRALSTAFAGLAAARGVGGVLTALSAFGRGGMARNLASTAAATAATGAAAGAAAGKAGKFSAALNALGLGGPRVALALNPLVAGAAAAAGAALLLGGNSAEEAQGKFDSLIGTSERAGRALENVSKGARGGFQGLASETQNLKSANEQVSVAQAEVNRLVRAGKTGTAEYRTALNNLNGALLMQQQAQDSVKTSAGELHRRMAALGQTEKVLRPAQRAIRGAADETRKWLDITKTKELTGKHPFDLDLRDLIRYKDQLPAIAGREEELGDAIDNLETAYRRLQGAQQDRINAQRQAAVAEVNFARAMRGMVPLADKAGVAIKNLRQQVGRKQTAEIAIKFPDPRDAERVMRAISRTIASGTSKRRAINVVLNAENTEDALRRLNRIRLTPKRLEVIERGGDQAVRVLERIAGRKLTPKEVRIAQRGGENVIRLLERILGHRLPGKTQNINERGGNQVEGKLRTIAGIPLGTATKIIREQGGSSVLGTLASIAAKTVLGTATKIINVITRGGKAAGGASYAAGGRTSDEVAAAASIERQARRAERGQVPTLSRAATQRGRKVNTPTLLTGEERRTEFVIATNPRYRKSNLRYLSQAARALGVTDPIEAAAAGSPAYMAPAKLPERPMLPRRAAKLRKSKKPKKRKQGNAYKVQNQWSSYMASLKTQSDDWEREVSIREMQVEEPEDFIVDTGRKLPSGDPEYAIDQPAIDSYAGQLERVRQAYQKLVGIDRAIVAAAPQARRANLDEIAKRKTNIGNFEDVIKRNRGATKSKNEETRSRAESRIDKARRGIDREREAINVLREDIATYSEDEKEAGFSYRENTIQRDDTAQVMSSLTGRATQERNEANAQPPPDAAGGTGGASGGGDSGGVSYGQQAALADSERAQVLRDFGSNFKPVAAAAAAGVQGAMASSMGGAASPVAAAAGQAGAAAAKTLMDRAGGGGGGAAGIAAGDAVTAKMDRSAGVLGGAGTGAGAAEGATVNKTVNVTNNFKEQPKDPHSWSAGVSFELGALV